MRLFDLKIEVLAPADMALSIITKFSSKQPSLISNIFFVEIFRDNVFETIPLAPQSETFWINNLVLPSGDPLVGVEASAYGDWDWCEPIDWWPCAIAAATKSLLGSIL
jgi:hypothetical protein